MKTAAGAINYCKNSKAARCAFLDRSIDLAHLARYTKGNSAVERELLFRFQKKATYYFKTMSSAKDSAVWDEAARNLQSAASAAGAWRILASAEQASRLPNEVNAPERVTLLARLDEEIREASAFIHGVM
ncbi:MAG: hypothetical protein P8Y67_01505 [Alphaproteobacteria bacterium]